MVHLIKHDSNNPGSATSFQKYRKRPSWNFSEYSLGLFLNTMLTLKTCFQPINDTKYSMWFFFNNFPNYQKLSTKGKETLCETIKWINLTQLDKHF